MIMQSFYVTKDDFWNWFNRDDDEAEALGTTSGSEHFRPKQRTWSESSTQAQHTSNTKRMKTDWKPRSIRETEAVTRGGTRYIILFGRYKPGKRTKSWEGDGYLTMVGQTAHICDLRGRMLEEPTLLDEIDLKSVEDLSELVVGNTEIQVVEEDT